jgi:hypothetical protein
VELLRKEGAPLCTGLLWPHATSRLRAASFALLAGERKLVAALRGPESDGSFSPSESEANATGFKVA